MGAYKTFLRASVQPLDENARTAKVLEVLSRAGHSDLQIRDRQDASIVYDSLKKAAELRGRQTDERVPEIQFANDGEGAVNDSGYDQNDNVQLAASSVHHETSDPWHWYGGDLGDMWPFEGPNTFINDNGPHIL